MFQCDTNGNYLNRNSNSVLLDQLGPNACDVPTQRENNGSNIQRSKQRGYPVIHVPFFLLQLGY